MTNENTDDTAEQAVKKAIMDTGRVTAIINRVLDEREPALENRIMARVADVIPGYVRDGVHAGLEDIEKSIQLLANRIDTGALSQSQRITNVEGRQNRVDDKVDDMTKTMQVTREQMIEQSSAIKETSKNMERIDKTLHGDPNKTGDLGLRGDVSKIMAGVSKLSKRVGNTEIWQDNADRYIETAVKAVKAAAKHAWGFRRLIALAGIGGGTVGAFALKALQVLSEMV